MNAIPLSGMLALLLVASVNAQSPQDRQQAAPSDQAPGGAIVPGTAASGAAKNFLWGQLDANDNHFISPSEAAADDGVARQFRFLDINRDLKLDATEFSAYVTAPSTQQAPPSPHTKKRR